MHLLQTFITGARIFGDLDDPQSKVSEYVKKGAKGLEVAEGKLGPNSRYYGRKKDISLLFKDYTPKLADLTQTRRRVLLASLVKPVMKKICDIGLLGFAGAIVLQNVEKEAEKKR